MANHLRPRIFAGKTDLAPRPPRARNQIAEHLLQGHITARATNCWRVIQVRPFRGNAGPLRARLRSQVGELM